MADEGLGMKALDSNEVRKNQIGISSPRRRVSPVPISISGASVSPMATPQSFADLCLELQDSPPNATTLHYTPTPKLVQSNVYPQRVKPSSDPFVESESSHPKCSNPSQKGDLTPSQLPTLVHPITNPSIPSSSATSPKSPSPAFGPHSPTIISPSRKLQEVFQKAKDCLISKERVSSLILSIEEEMLKTGVTVHLTELKNPLHNVQDLQASSDEPVVFDASGDFFDPNAPEPDPPAPPVPPPKPKAKDWGSLFKAQGPSTGNKSEGASSSKLRRRQEKRKKPEQREKKKEKAKLKSDVNEAFSKEKEKMLYEIGFTEVEDMVTLLSLASLLDRSIANPSGSREMALGDRFTIEELDTLSDFAPQCTCFKPMNWKYSHSENISASMVHVKKFMEKSFDTMEPGNFTYADIYNLSERMLNSPFFTNVKIDVDEPVTTQLWGGGSLREWSEYFNDRMISQVVCCTGSSTQTQPRLTDMGRKVLRRLMKRVGDLHEHGCIHGNLDIDQVLVSSNFEVYLVDHPKPQKKFNHDGYEVDCKALHKVIREMLKKQNYPQDVLHLLRLLKEANWKRRDLIFSHTCTWSPSETIRTILAFRIEFFTGAEKNMIKEKAAKILKTVTLSWEERIPKGEPYGDCYKHWFKDLEESRKEKRGEKDDRPDGMLILLFMRSCIGHAYSKSKHLTRKTDLEVEADLFVIFPDFMPNFIESMEDMLKDVWKI